MTMFTNILNKCGIYTKTQHQAVSKTLLKAEEDYQALSIFYKNLLERNEDLTKDHEELLKAHDDLKVKYQGTFEDLEEMTKNAIDEQTKAMEAKALLAKAKQNLDDLKEQFETLMDTCMMKIWPEDKSL